MKYDENNVFAMILKGKIACKKVFEDDNVLAFHDNHPVAPVHILVIPKDSYTSFDDFCLADAHLFHNFFIKVREIAHLSGLEKSGYRLITNHGSDAMQTVKHYHVHILGSKKLGGLIAS